MNLRQQQQHQVGLRVVHPSKGALRYYIILTNSNDGLVHTYCIPIAQARAMIAGGIVCQNSKRDGP